MCSAYNETLEERGPHLRGCRQRTRERSCNQPRIGRKRGPSQSLLRKRDLRVVTTDHRRLASKFQRKKNLHSDAFQPVMTFLSSSTYCCPLSRGRVPKARPVLAIEGIEPSSRVWALRETLRLPRPTPPLAGWLADLGIRLLICKTGIRLLWVARFNS